ncbi:Ankyrin repeat-containing protein YAR1 [Spathaspora sp. JA1]|nr:Ankyrin repeat-containing protein YAR1 [Spathaspora sp. JA1]
MSIPELTQEEMDVVIYDARVGDLETLEEIFAEIPPLTLLTIKDDITLATPLHMACANGHYDTVKYLLSILPKQDAKDWISARNENGNTALHWAGYNGHLSIVELLIDEYDGDVFIKNDAGHDVLYEVESNGQEEVENWLLKRFAIEEETTEDGDTKITYTAGTESKLADEQARDASFKASTPDVEEIDKKTDKLSLN